MRGGIRAQKYPVGATEEALTALYQWKLTEIDRSVGGKPPESGGAESQTGTSPASGGGMKN